MGGDLPDPGVEPVSLMSPALADGFFTTSASGRCGHVKLLCKFLNSASSQFLYPDHCGLMTGCRLALVHAVPTEYVALGNCSDVHFTLPENQHPVPSLFPPLAALLSLGPPTTLVTLHLGAHVPSSVIPYPLSSTVSGLSSEVNPLFCLQEPAPSSVPTSFFLRPLTCLRVSSHLHSGS